MVTFDVFVAGVSKTYHDLSFARPLAFEPYVIMVDFPPSITGISSGNEIQIKRDNALLSKGSIERKFLILDQGQKLLRIEGISNFYKISDRTVGVGEDVGEPRTLISNALTGTGIALNPGANFGSNVRIRKDGDQVHDYIRRILQNTNWESRIKPDDTMDFASQLGTDKSASVVFETGKHVNVLNFEETVTPIVNRWRAFGKGDSETNRITLPAPGYVEDVPSQTSFRLVERPLIARDVSTQADLQTLSNKVLARTKDKVTTVILDIVDPKTTGDYDLGDTVRLVDTIFGLTGNYRIQRHSIFYSSETGERVTLELSNRFPSIENLIAAFQAQLDFANTNPQLFDKPTGVSNVDNTTGVSNVGNTTGVGNVNGATLITANPSAHFQPSGDTGDSTLNPLDLQVTAPSAPAGAGAGEKFVVVLQGKIVKGGADPQRFHVDIQNVTAVLVLAEAYAETNDAKNTIWLTAIHAQGPGTTETYRLEAYDMAGALLTSVTTRLRVIKWMPVHTHGIVDPGHPHSHSETAHPHSHSEVAHPHSHSDPTHTH